MEKKKVIGFYDYTVILTYMGMIFSFTGILNAIHGSFLKCIICLLAAGVCDMFDGAVAATKDRNCYEKHFGIQIDSLSDLISFGVLPAVFVYQISGEKRFVGAIATFYVLCALIRLAYFNVQEFDRQQKTTEKRSVYLGVPVTTIAVILPLAFVIYENFLFPNTLIFDIILGLVAVGFISGIEIKKPKVVGKILVIVIGILEVIGVFLLTGADIL